MPSTLTCGTTRARCPPWPSAVATDLSRLEPAHAAYFKGNVKAFDNSLQPWFNAIASFKKAHPGTPVAVTEPVADYMLAGGWRRHQDPAAVAGGDHERHRPVPSGHLHSKSNCSRKHEVKVFLYNQQVTDSLTATFLSDAKKAHVPVVGVYETMPTPGYDYQSWMMAEMNALRLAAERDVYCKALMTTSGEPASAQARQRPAAKIPPWTSRTSAVAAGRPRDPPGSVVLGGSRVAHRPHRRERCRQDDPAAGNPRPPAYFFGRGPSRARAPRAALHRLCPQKVVLDPDLPVRARDLVELGADGRRLGIPMRSNAKRALVDQLLQSVDASHLADARVGALSGGEQQRVLIAHALASQPRLLLLDEPLASLDPRSTQETASLLGRIASERKVGVLLSTHDINPLLPVMDRVVYLAAGRAVSGRTEEVVRSDVLSALYRHHVDVFHAHGRVLVSVGEEAETSRAASWTPDDCADPESRAVKTSPAGRRAAVTVAGPGRQ